MGRDDFIARLWDSLARQSVRLTAERRMGKTSVIKKMAAQPAPDVTAIYRSFEDVSSTAEFVDTLVAEVRDHLPGRLKATRRIKALLQDLDVRVDAGPVHISLASRDEWKQVVRAVFQALGETERICFFWDEVPVMIGAINDGEGATVAHEVLDVLRVARQTHDSVRMVFTGSVGLHHVLDTVSPADYSRAPVNDMLAAELEGLAQADALQLTRNLLAGESVHAADEIAVAQAVGEVTSGIPFYIQHVVGALAAKHKEANVPDVLAVVEECLLSPIDPWHFHHYRRRISDYYGDREPVALAVLDALAVADGPMRLADLVNVARLRGPIDDEAVRDVLRLLQLDHYIGKDADGYRFSFEIVGRAWRVQRDLA